MDRDVKISVIIPAYNVAQWLPRCIESVLGQTYQNLEIWIINDGSTDDTGRIIDEYAAKDPRIHAVHQENHGVSHARNVGMSMVSGDAVSFIDSDDTLEPEMYELLVRVMQEHNADISHCGYKHIVGEEIRLVHDTKKVMPQNTWEALECFVNGRLFGGGLWNKLFCSELISKIRFREDLKINEDILFAFEAFFKSQKSVFADYAMYNYFAHFGTSAVFRTPDEKKITDTCEVAKYIYMQLAGTELNDAAAERYIRALRGYYNYCAEHTPSRCKQIAADMQTIAATAASLGRNMKLTVRLIKFCPWLYRLVYGIYSKVRKPQWEARKD